MSIKTFLKTDKNTVMYVLCESERFTELIKIKLIEPVK